MPVSTHKKRQSVKFPLDLSIGKKETYKLRRAIDRPTVIRISESGKLLLVKSGIQEFFFVKSVFLGHGIWGLESGFPCVDSRIQDCLVLYFFFYYFFLLVQFNRVLQRLEITKFMARTLDRPFSSFVDRMAISSLIFRWTVQLPI